MKWTNHMSLALQSASPPIANSESHRISSHVLARTTLRPIGSHLCLQIKAQLLSCAIQIGMMLSRSSAWPSLYLLTVNWTHWTCLIRAAPTMLWSLKVETSKQWGPLHPTCARAVSASSSQTLTSKSTKDKPNEMIVIQKLAGPAASIENQTTA